MRMSGHVREIVQDQFVKSANSQTQCHGEAGRRRTGSTNLACDLCMHDDGMWPYAADIQTASMAQNGVYGRYSRVKRVSEHVSA